MKKIWIRRQAKCWQLVLLCLLTISYKNLISNCIDDLNIAELVSATAKLE